MKGKVKTLLMAKIDSKMKYEDPAMRRKNVRPATSLNFFVIKREKRRAEIKTVAVMKITNPWGAPLNKM